MDVRLLDALGEDRGHDGHCDHGGYDLRVVRVARCFARLVNLQLGLSLTLFRLVICCSNLKSKDGFQKFRFYVIVQSWFE